jgi:REP element-mobilizing transposase RayT
MVPRQILPGSTYFVSRRCTQRQFLLTPTPQTTRIFGYCLAVAAARCNIQVHAACVMSNHWHAVVTDPDARIPEFLGYLHKYVAKAVNAALGRWENLWATEQPSLVRLVGPEDVLAEILYLITNPVAAGLVAWAKRWPGLLCYLPRHSKTFARPEIFFRPDGPLPSEAPLQLTVAPALANLDVDEFERRLSALVRADEDRFAREREASGRACLGVDRVLAQLPTAQPRSREPRRKLSPKVAARDKGRRLEALRLLRDFVAAYREARSSWRKGLRAVLFPPGTYALRIYAGVLCQPAAP